MPISIADLRTTPFQVGTYAPAGAGMPVLRRTDGSALGTGIPPENEHLVAHNGIVGYTNGPAAQPGSQLISFRAAGTHNNAAYLPYRDNNISSITFDSSVNRFFTDNLSGCSVFVDRLPNGNMVVYHANVQGGAYRPTEEQSLNVRYERQLAVAVKRQYHINAARHYAGAVSVGSLFKDRYNANAAAAVNVARFANTPVLALGTTVVGFRTGAGWQFWYQTWIRSAANVFVVAGAEQFC